MRRRNLFILLLLAIPPALLLSGLVLARTFDLIRAFVVPTGSMAPTLSPGDCVFAERLSLLAREPRPGDIIIFRTGRIPRLKEHGDQFYIMRIVAGAGDRIHWRDGHIYINGKERLEILSPRGLFTVPSYRFPETDGSVYVVPEASYYVIGDNSANSFDSRFWGAVPRSQIVFKPVIRYWPPSRFGPLERSGSELPGS